VQRVEFALTQNSTADLLHLDAVQGANEQWTEPYLNTVKEQSQFVTQQCARNGGRVPGSARTQADVVQRSCNG